MANEDVRVSMKLTKAGDLELREVSVFATRWEVAELIVIVTAFVCIGAVAVFGGLQLAAFFGVLAALRVVAAIRRRRKIVRDIKVATANVASREG